MKRYKSHRKTLKPSHYRLCDRLNDLARGSHRDETIKGYQWLRLRWRWSFEDVRRAK